MEELKEIAEKEINRIEEISKNLGLIDRKGEKLKELFDSYHKDAKHFFQNKKYVEAFEAAIICWAYVDAGLHLGIFRVNKKIRDWFTV